MKLKFYVIPAAVAAACLVFAAVVRFSYSDAGAKIYDYNYAAGGELTDVLKKNGVAAPEDVINQADLIVEAKYSGNRKVTKNAFFSEVDVGHVYKGDGTLAGKEICVIESMWTFTKTHFLNAGGTFSIPLRTGESTLLLLKHKQFDPERKLDAFQKSQYYPVTKSVFGCYRLSPGGRTELVDENKAYTVHSLKDFNIFTGDPQTLETYKRYRAWILGRFGIR